MNILDPKNLPDGKSFQQLLTQQFPAHRMTLAPSTHRKERLCVLPDKTIG